MSRALNVIPFALMHNLKHNKVLHERVILLTLRTEDAPYVHNVRRVQIEQLSPTFWRVVASYGWRETPNVEEVFHRCGLEGLSCRMMETSFFMSHESLIIGKRPGICACAVSFILSCSVTLCVRLTSLRSRLTA